MELRDKVKKFLGDSATSGCPASCGHLKCSEFEETQRSCEIFVRKECWVDALMKLAGLEEK